MSVSARPSWSPYCSCASRARSQPVDAVTFATEARREAERQALVSFQFYGLALEAAARMDSGESHAAALLATTALGAVENLQGCEYGLEIRVLCADVLSRAESPQAAEAKLRAIAFAGALLGSIRDRRLRRLFARRTVVTSLAAPELMSVAAEPDRFPVAAPLIADSSSSMGGSA